MPPPLKNIYGLLLFMPLFFVNTSDAQTNPATGCLEVRVDTQAIKKAIFPPKQCVPTKIVLVNKGCEKPQCCNDTQKKTKTIVIDTIRVIVNGCDRIQDISRDSLNTLLKKIDKLQLQKENNTNSTLEHLLQTFKIQEHFNFISAGLALLLSFLAIWVVLFCLFKMIRKLINNLKDEINKTKGPKTAEINGYLPFLSAALTILIAFFKFLLFYVFLLVIVLASLIFIAAILYFQFIKYIQNTDDRKFDKKMTALARIIKLQKEDNNSLKYDDIKKEILDALKQNINK